MCFYFWIKKLQNIRPKRKILRITFWNFNLSDRKIVGQSFSLLSLSAWSIMVPSSQSEVIDRNRSREFVLQTTNPPINSTCQCSCLAFPHCAFSNAKSHVFFRHTWNYLELKQFCKKSKESDTCWWIPYWWYRCRGCAPRTRIPCLLAQKNISTTNDLNWFQGGNIHFVKKITTKRDFLEI